MKTIRLFLPLFAFLVLISCDREEEIIGCTDHLAENHDPRATVDDGSCTFSDDSQLVWRDGQPGGWNGNLTTYGIVPEVCKGSIEVLTDTSFTEQPMRIFADAGGEVHLHFRLLNPRTARNYNTGYVHFDVLKPEGSGVQTLEIYTHGKRPQQSSECGAFNRSHVVEISTLTLPIDEWHTVSIPFLDFTDLMLADIRIMFGVQTGGHAPESEVLQLNNIRWTRF